MTSGPQTSSSPSNDASFGNQMPIEQNGVSSESIQRRSMVPNISEEVSNSVEKDGISYVLEARSLSAVVRYVYTPLEGNLSDIEVEINNADAIKFAENGGVTIEMGGQIRSAEDEDVERHFVSCELVGNAIEARWHWKYGEELADFLYRISIQDKSLIVELEGGNAKATGVDLGYVSGAVNPRTIQVPYLAFGDDYPRVLATSGVFVFSMLDWHSTASSAVYAPKADELGNEVRIGGGCQYHPTSDGRRHVLSERWILTVSRQFDEVIPNISTTEHIKADELHDFMWYQVPPLPASEEAYVEVYEQLRSFKAWGLDNLIVNHCHDVWEDANGRTSLSLIGSESKGGNDALIEYLDAVEDLGYQFTLPVGYTEISPEDEEYSAELTAIGSDGNPIATNPNRFLLKTPTAIDFAESHLPKLFERFNSSGLFLFGHTTTTASTRIDYDCNNDSGSSFAKSWEQEKRLLAKLQSIADQNSRISISDGGSHWLYSGLISSFFANIAGPNPSRVPLLLDFELKTLHNAHLNVGIGTIGQFFGDEFSSETADAIRISCLDRYIATTAAYGHAGLLPDIQIWGLPAAIKTYFLLHKLQTRYLSSTVESILYHRSGAFLEANEALVSGAYEDSQVQINYANGLCLCVNGSFVNNWTIEHEQNSYVLPPASFFAYDQSADLLVYSADTGQGRLDFAKCGEYFYCDTRGERYTFDSITLTGAALVKTEDWQIDIYPVQCDSQIEVRPSELWPDRRMPKLRVLAFNEDSDVPSVLSSNVANDTINLQPQEGISKFRITLPEWMVEPGK